MTFLAGWALAGLGLLAPLVILHLRHPTGRTREVPSLLLWPASELGASGPTRCRRRPPLPLLLTLQAAALILLILALAEPMLTASAPAPMTVVVLDDSYWMNSPGTLAHAKHQVTEALNSVPAGSTVRLVLADGTPSVVYRGSRSGAGGALDRVVAGSAPPDLSSALAVAAGLLAGPHDRVLVVRSGQDTLPPLRASPGELWTVAVSRFAADQGIFDPIARCGIGSTATCEVIATLTNAGASPVEERVLADVPGRPGLSLSTQVAAHSSTHIQLLATPGEQVRLTLEGSDALSLDNTAWVSVPGEENLPRAAVVTVVGTPGHALALAQAFAAVPGVAVGVDTPANYRPRLARASDLIVLDGWLPPGGIPGAPAVMLVDPPTLPGGRVDGAQADSTLSGSDPASPLLAGVDPSSLTVDGGAARRLTLPHWLTPVLWSPSGPLLAAGDNGHTRLVVTAFQTGGSNLAQLAGFPVLATDIVSWALGWAPASATAGMPIRVDALLGARTATLQHNGTTSSRVELSGATAVLSAPTPGVYTLRETGPGLSHQATVDVNLGASPVTAAEPVDLRAAQIHPSRSPADALAPWLLAAALLMLAVEWGYWSTRRDRVRV